METYRGICRSLAKRIEKLGKPEVINSIVLKKIDEICKDRIHYLHKSFIVFAIARSLDIEPKEVQLSSICSSRSLKLPQIERLFQEIKE